MTSGSIPDDVIIDIGSAGTSATWKKSDFTDSLTGICTPDCHEYLDLTIIWTDCSTCDDPFPTC